MNRLPLIIGHRGASSHAPENTVAAIKMAIDAGADGVEFDVRLSADGVPVVIHDADLARVAGSNAAVSQLSSNDLSAIDVGSWFNSAFPAKASAAYSLETVQPLENVLNLLADSQTTVYVELKTDGNDPDALVRECCSLFGDSPIFSRLIVKSFHLEAIRKVKEELAGIQTAALFEPGVKTLFRRRADLVEMAARHGAGHISLHWSLITRGLVEAANRAEMPVTVWTVDNPSWVSKGRRLGVGALITNDPERLLSVRDAASSLPLAGNKKEAAD